MREAVRIGEPTGEVVDLPTLKVHCSVDGTSRDGILAIYLAAATDFAERYTGRALLSQQWELVLDEFPTGDLVLPFGPVESVDEILYVDPDEIETELGDAEYSFDLASTEARIRATDGWPETFDEMNAVTVRWTTKSADLTPALVVAVMMLAGHYFENREAVITGTIATTLPLGVKDLLDRYRRFKG